MNIWNTIIITFSHSIAAVLIFVGLQAPTVPPQTTTIDIQPSGQVTSVTTQEAPKQAPVAPLPTEPTVETPDPQNASTTPEPITLPAPTQQQTYIPVIIVQSPQATAPIEPEPTTMPKKPKEAPVAQNVTLELFAPMAGNWIKDRQYLAEPQQNLVDEYNYVELGLIVRNEAGEALKDVVVSVHTTDPEQNKEINGTGDVRKIYKDGNPTLTPYYAFTYTFKTVGKHEIIFETNGTAVTQTFEIAKDDRKVTQVKQ